MLVVPAKSCKNGKRIVLRVFLIPCIKQTDCFNASVILSFIFYTFLRTLKTYAMLAVVRYLQSETDKSQCYVTFDLESIVSLDARLEHLRQTTVLQHVLIHSHTNIVGLQTFTTSSFINC